MSTITQDHVGTPVVLDIDGSDVPGVLLALMDDLKYGARVQVGARIEMHRAAIVRPAAISHVPVQPQGGDQP